MIELGRDSCRDVIPSRPAKLATAPYPPPGAIYRTQPLRWLGWVSDSFVFALVPLYCGI